ncbi:MAG TPA: hypothetical protein VEX86_03035 [Longimicrobium sp.]|nr:hypothetical protein [Longimicrobium sp.]
MPHPEVLSLDPERLLRLADAYRGYAGALRDAPAELRPWAASSLLLGAAYAALVDPGRARYEFARAAAAYAEEDAPLAAVLAICAGDDGLVRELTGGEEDLWGASPLRRLAVVLGRAWLTETDDPPPELDQRGAGGHAYGFVFGPAGRLGVPVAAYAAAFDEVRRAAHELREVPRGPVVFTGASPARRSLPAVCALLERAAEPVLAAMADRFHWQRAHSTVLPAEPEAVAAGRCVLRTWARRGRREAELFALLGADQLHPVALVPLEVAADLENGEERDGHRPPVPGGRSGGPGEGEIEPALLNLVFRNEEGA